MARRSCDELLIADSFIKAPCRTLLGVSFILFFFFFLNPLNFTEGRQRCVRVVQTCFTNWDKYVDVREKKRKTLTSRC